MTEAQREPFEQFFAADFRKVRIHDDGAANAAADELGANAFTLGSDIYFAPGAYKPDSATGRRLMAHELAHTLQEPRPSHARRDPVRNAAPQAAQQNKPEIKFKIGWLTSEGTPVETNEQVAALARLAILSLEEDIEDLQSEAVRKEAREWITRITAVLPYFDQHTGEKIDPGLIGLINGQYDELVRLRSAIEQDRLVQIKEVFWREHDAAIKAAEEAEALQSALDDGIRAAYRKGSGSSLKEAVSAVKGMLSIGRSLRSLAADITKDILGLPIARGTYVHVDWWAQYSGPKITFVNVGKYTETLGKLGRGLSALNLALTIADRSKKATEAEQGMKDLSDAVSIGTDLISASPLAAPPHFSLYSTIYLKPALKIVAKQVAMLVENLSNINRISVETTGDLMYPKAEPGGQEMFDLMVKVMHAESEKAYPALPSGVEDYLYEHREKLGIGAESDVPTEGSLFWKKMDSAAGRRWLFANRHRVWAMFYGSMKVP